MLKYFSLSFLFIFSSCIPLSIAPKIENKKIVKAKRFKRDLPIGNGYIMEDPKDADEFYHFINMRYDCGYIDVEYNVPFTIDNKTYYLSFYEREKSSKTLNIIPLAIDAGLDRKGYGPFFEDAYVSRKGKWYIILYVRDENFKDCLSDNFKDKEEITYYLDELRKEYLNTGNYIATYLRNN